jgi:glycosyltransferase involved in cell wall biosynthesis
MQNTLRNQTRNKNTFISVVVPVYQAENLVRELVEKIFLAAKLVSKDFEIILVEDGGIDRSWEAIQRACTEFPGIHGVKLSRNFGQHYAISAGLSLAKGKWVVVMDCDLQDQPSEIPKMIAKAQEGFDVVQARRVLRRDGFCKKLASSLFYRTLSWLTGANHDPAIANFGAYSSKVVKAINSMPETIRYFPTMVKWVGFRCVTVDVKHAARSKGKTSYDPRRLLNLALDICLAYSDKPLRMVLGIGFLVSAMGFGFAILTIIQAIQGEIQVLGYASLMVSIWLLAGIMIFIIGVVGLYVGKCFEGIKRRPAFIVSQEINGKPSAKKHFR